MVKQTDGKFSEQVPEQQLIARFDFKSALGHEIAPSPWRLGRQHQRA
jgi:hypothetical protein